MGSRPFLDWESSLDRMEFRGLTLKEAIGTFTKAAYDERLDVDHA